MSAWIIIVLGAIVWGIGQKIPLPKQPEGLRFGRIVSLVGLLVFLFGAYAGWQGPLSVGTATINPVSFAHFMQKANSEALVYAKAHIQLSSRPTAVWRGRSKTSLTCTVINNGTKDLQSLTFTFATKNQSTISERIRGPYLAGQKREVHIELSNNVLQSYFDGAGMNAGQISAATF